MGEYLHGARRGSRDFVYVRVDNGISAGVVLDGVLQLGATGNTAELGHLVVDEDGPPCFCGSHGCLQVFASGDAVSRRAREHLRAGEHSVMAELVGGALDLIDWAIIVNAAAAGDHLACQVLREAGGYLGRGLAAVVNLLNPDTIVLGGRFGAAAAPYFEAELTRALRQMSLSVPVGAVRILPGTLGEDAVTIGAAALALEAVPFETGK
jgi:predicted NBD/HSP70 family sugar kinase